MRKRMSHYDPSQLPQTQWQQPIAPTQTEWRRIPSQPLSQSPLPNQPLFQPQPPKKRGHNGLWITLGAVVAMVALLSFAIGWQNRSQLAISKLSTSATSGHQRQPTPVVNTPIPQPTLVINAIGKAVVVDSTWTITVNSAKTNAGDPFSMPGVGNTYLVVDITVKNTSKHYQDMASGLQLVLKDSAGRKYMETITDFATPPDGSIKFGEFLRGQLAYEIPATEHTFSYYFQADSEGTDLTEWTLKV